MLDANRNLVVIGASAEGVEDLSRATSGLSANLPAAVCGTLPLAASMPSILNRIIERSPRLPVKFPEIGEGFRLGQIYLAPPIMTDWIRRNRSDRCAALATIAGDPRREVLTRER